MYKSELNCLLMMMVFLLCGCSSPSSGLLNSNTEANFETKTKQTANVKTMATSDVQAERYLIHKSGEMVFDSTTKLVWMRCSLGQKWDGRTCSGTATKFKFDEANHVANAFNSAGGLNGHTDWIVPAVEPLQSLRLCSTGIDNKGSSWHGHPVRSNCNKASLQPTISTLAMPSTPIGSFMSATPLDSRFWFVNFKDGAVITHYIDGFYVRLMRATPITGDPVALGFSREQITTSENAIRQASTDWSYDDLKGATQRFIDLGNKSGSVYSIYKSGSVSSFANQKACSLDTQNVRKFLLSGASEIWYRHGRSDVDEMHSISEENMLWVGNCLNGKANGEGIIVYFYQGKINSSGKVGAVRTVITVNNGTPTGTVFAYSNARTCFNSCQDNKYAKEIGKLSEGAAGVNLAQQDVAKVSNQNNQAMGAILGSVMVKAAEVLKEGAAASSTSSTSSGSTKVWEITGSRKVVANGWHREISVRCIGSRRTNEIITILVLNSGRYEPVNQGGKYDTLDQAAEWSCK